jgi:hypothetical protein
MFPDTPRPDFPASGSKSDAGIKPTDEDVVKALVEIEKATTTPSPSADSPIHLVPERPWFMQSSPVVRVKLILALGGLLVALLGFLVTRQAASRAGRTISGWNQKGASGVIVRNVDSSTQAEAEEVLTRLASGNTAAADEVLARSSDWTGKTHRTPKSEQMVSTALNRPDLHLRAAAVQAELALDGVQPTEAGLAEVEQTVGNPSQRVWALWMLGALANRGVDPVHTAKIIETYLTDPQVDVRAGAVDALALVASDETVPMLLDRFRNDPSPVVQERAACDLAESGMYTHEQRLTAAASLVGWLDDSLLTPQQRTWTVQALSDISGKNFGTDTAAWRTWYESTQ